MKNVMNKNSIYSTFAFAMLCGASAFAQAPAGYYDSLDGKSGTDLFNAVKAVAKKGHHAISYGDATWDAFRSTDVHTVNGQQCWWDMYSDNNVAISSGHPGLNIEHTVANSWWGGTKNDAYKDIVHLNPSNSDANSRKGNYPIGEISGASTWNNGVTFVGHPVSGQGGGCSMVYEPHDMYKGDFARVFMYMFVVYDDITWKEASSNSSDGKGRMYSYSGGKATLLPWASDLILTWSANDPVSEKETSRNNGIYKEQGNRNPFIDLPDLADYIWGSKRNQAYSIAGDHNPEPGPGPGEDDDPPVTPPVIPGETQGKYLLAQNQNDIMAGESYVIVAESTMTPMSVTTGNNCLKPAGGDSPLSVAGDILSDLPAGTAIITLEADGNQYRLKISDTSGKDLGYVASPKSKTVTITENPTDSGTSASISLNSGKAQISYGSAGLLKYNTSAKMYRTYPSTTGGMEDLLLYRYIPDTETEVKNVEPDRFRVIIKGNDIIAPDDCQIFNLNGIRVSGHDLPAGLYIVVSPKKNKAIKAIIR